MVNWFKAVGAALVVLGGVVALGNPVVVYHDGEHDYRYLYGTVSLGIALIAIGMYLYYLGNRKQNKGV